MNIRNLSILASCALFGAGCGGSPSGAVITYGAVLDRTGSISMISWFDAAALATAHANAGLAQAGKSLTFNLATSDSTNTPAVTVTRATELVRNANAKAIITDSSQDDIALNRTNYTDDPTSKLNVPIIGMTCTAPSINDPNAVDASDPVNQATLRNGLKWNFRTVMNSDLQAAVITRIAVNRAPGGDVNGDGRFKIGFYGTTSAGAGTGFAAGVQAALDGLKLTPPPVVEALYSPATLDANTYNFAADIAKLTDNRNEATGVLDGYPDVIMVITFPQYNAAIVKAYVNGGNTIPLLQTHTARFYSTLVAGGSVFEGQEGTSPTVLDNGASGSVFAATYQAMAGVAPQYLDANTYDSAMLIMLSAVAASKSLEDPTQVTGAQIRDALRTINAPGGTVVRTGPEEFAKAVGLLTAGQPINYEGASGPVDFDENLNVIDRVAHWKVVNGQYVEVEKYDCVASPTCPLLK